MMHAPQFAMKTLEIPCIGDITGDGTIGTDDMLVILNNWGRCVDPEDCPGDVNGDGLVNVDDMTIVLNNWGPCP